MNHGLDNSPWTDERIATLKRMWGEGATRSQIAAALGGGISRNAVIGKAHRLGLASRPSPIIRDGRPSPMKGKRRARSLNADAATSAAAARKRQVAAPEPPKVQGYVPRPRISSRECAWPEGEALPYRFCGAPTVEGKPYCTDHCRLAYRGTPTPEPENLRPLFQPHKDETRGYRIKRGPIG